MDETPIYRLRVVNRNDFVITDRYDGVPVTFKPGESVDLSLEAARHIIGYPAERDLMNVHMAKRWGWNRPEHVVINPQNGKMRFQELASNIDVNVETYEIRRIDAGEPAADLTEDELAEARSSLGRMG